MVRTLGVVVDRTAESLVHGVGRGCRRASQLACGAVAHFETRIVARSVSSEVVLWSARGRLHHLPQVAEQQRSLESLLFAVQPAVLRARSTTSKRAEREG